MTKSFYIGLRPGEIIFINGAVIRVDRKTTLELLNDATFLLQGHYLQPEQATTPLRKLYYIVQTMLIEPHKTDGLRASYEEQCLAVLTSCQTPEMAIVINKIARLLDDNKTFDALKYIRDHYTIEAEHLASTKTTVRHG